MRIVRRLLPLAWLGVFLVVCAGMALPAGAQTTAPNEWAWMGGSNTSGSQVGVYGTLGVPAIGNVPSSRTGAVGWTDKSGNLWLFGGYGNSVSPSFVDELDDLWEFDPSTNGWAWMGGTYPYMAQAGVYGTLGTPAAGNWPGSRQSPATWTDANGNFWLFGGSGYDSANNPGLLNDLWEFNPSTGYWVWVGGSSTVPLCGSDYYCGQNGTYGTLRTQASSNIPGGRWGESTWIDSKGKFWLFGGFGLDSGGKLGELDDLWEFSPSQKEWTWMGGSSAMPCYSQGYCGEPGVYGVLGNPASANIPGGRDSAVGWIDNSGNFWLFAGEGRDSVSAWGSLNDLWEFDPASSEWVWIDGSDTIFGNAIYGKLQAPAVGDIPAGGNGANAWTDKSGNPWVFGGSTGSNDLWEFDASANEWAWMGGNGALDNLSPVYGTLGTPAAGNIPGGRNGAASWIDKSGNFWLFGGDGFVGSPYEVEATLNDLWEYVAPSAPAPLPSFALYASPASVTVEEGSTGTATINTIVADGFDSTVSLTSPQTYVSFSPSSITGTGTSQMTIDVSAGIWTSSSAITVTGTSGGISETTQVMLNVVAFPPAATPTFGLASGTYATAQMVTISDATVGATIYYTTDGTLPTIDSTIYIGAITVSSTETLKAVALASDASTSAVASATYTIPPSFSVAASPGSMSVFAGGSGTTTVTVTPANGFNAAVSFSCSGLPAGATCSFSPATVTPPGTTSTTLTVATSSSTAEVRRGSGALWPGAAMAVVACCFGLRKRRRLLMLVVIVGLGGLGLLSGCGGGGSGGGGGGGGTQPVTSTVTVTGTSGTLQQSTTFTLTVN